MEQSDEWTEIAPVDSGQEGFRHGGLFCQSLSLLYHLCNALTFALLRSVASIASSCGCVLRVASRSWWCMLMLQKKCKIQVRQSLSLQTGRCRCDSVCFLPPYRALESLFAWFDCKDWWRPIIALAAIYLSITTEQHPVHINKRAYITPCPSLIKSKLAPNP